MNVFYDKELEWKQGDPNQFTGCVQLKQFLATDEGQSVKVYRVKFEPEARTHWHAHSGVQLLFVVEGHCRVQKWAEDVQEIGPGDTVCISADEKHWHGAVPGSSMTHIAVTINAETTWMEEVSDQGYSK